MKARRPQGVPLVMLMALSITILCIFFVVNRDVFKNMGKALVSINSYVEK